MRGARSVLRAGALGSTRGTAQIWAIGLAVAAAQSWRVSMNTGNCRLVLAWCSPRVGYSATSFGHSSARPGPHGPLGRAVTCAAQHPAQVRDHLRVDVLAGGGPRNSRSGFGGDVTAFPPARGLGGRTAAQQRGGWLAGQRPSPVGLLHDDRVLVQRGPGQPV